MFDLKTKVLVVDDMLTMRKIIIKVCKELGFTDIVEAPDGAQAWKVISESPAPIQLVISDWNMPNLSGLELLKKVRADGKLKALPFIMVTAEAEQHQIVEAIKAGVNSYVVKPFTADTLKTKLEAVHQKLTGAK